MKTIKLLSIVMMIFLGTSCVIENDDVYQDSVQLEIQKSNKLAEQPPQWLTLDPCHEENIAAGFELYRDETYTGCIWLKEPTEPFVIEIKCE